MLAEEKSDSTTTPSVKKLSKKIVAEAPVAHEEPAIAEVAPTKPSTTIGKRVVKPKVEEPPVVPETEVQVQVAVPEVKAEALDQPVATEIAAEPVVGPSGTTVKKLTLTPDALKKGIKPGDKLV